MNLDKSVYPPIKQIMKLNTKKTIVNFVCEGKKINDKTIEITLEEIIDFLIVLIREEERKIFKAILDENKDDLTGFYDYDGIAETVIKLAKK